MSHVIKKYHLEVRSEFPWFVSVPTHAGAAFLAAQEVAHEEYVVWFAVDDTKPEETATLYMLVDDKPIAKTLSETLVHLTTLFHEGGEARHLFVQIDSDNVSWVLGALAEKQVAPDTKDEEDKEAHDAPTDS